jgi:hypothetical protein
LGETVPRLVCAALMKFVHVIVDSSICSDLYPKIQPRYVPRLAEPIADNRYIVVKRWGTQLIPMEQPIALYVDYTRIGGAKPVDKIDFGRNSGFDLIEVLLLNLARGRVTR